MSAIPAQATGTRPARQSQFLEVLSRDEATLRFQRQLDLAPLGRERVPLAGALNRVLADTVVAPVDVPGFDRSNVDGFALVAADSFGAMEESPRRVRLNAELLSPGRVPQQAVAPGMASAIATGAMLPRGADAVVMMEHTELVADEQGQWLELQAAVAPGQNISFAGTDMARGETVLHPGCVLGSREIGVLASLGLAEVEVVRRPTVAILSTGDEIIAPGEPARVGTVYDSNAAILAAAVRELGGEPVNLGVFRDDGEQLAAALNQALVHDVVLLSGGTSKGAGDLSYRVVSRLEPGILAHGVALKPGKPICLAANGRKPVVILPGFPTSAVFTFHEFVAPVIRSLAGRPPEARDTVEASLPMRLNSERGRTEFLLVSLIEGEWGLVAYPMGKGSGSVTAFSHADGFVTIPQHDEILEANARVKVQRLGRHLRPAGLVAIGSHCVGLDLLLSAVQRSGITVKTLHVGSMGGLAAIRRGECDIAGIHLLDPESGEYNRPFLEEGMELIPGYGRMQGILFRADDSRFSGKSVQQLTQQLPALDAAMVNRNAGSGTRILIDGLLKGARPPGYGLQTKSHNAVAATIAQGRADWGIAIDTVARAYGLGFIPLQQERYDFVVPTHRMHREGIQCFQRLLREPAIRARLKAAGFYPDD